jgi:ankyrin repeat protein
MTIHSHTQTVAMLGLLFAAQVALGAVSTRPVTVEDVIAATRSGATDAMGSMLEAHPDLIDGVSFAVEGDTCTPLLAACARQHTQCVRWLIEHHADVNHAPRGDSPLFVAARQGDMDVLRALLDTDVNINGNVKSPQLTPLAVALFYDHPEAAEALRKKGAELDIFSAAGLGAVDWMRDALKNDPSLARSANAWGSTPLHFAGVRGQIESARVLLEFGADVNAAPGQGRETALHQAARHNHAAFVHFLLAHGANDQLLDDKGMRASDWAASFNADEAQGQLQP